MSSTNEQLPEGAATADDATDAKDLQAGAGGSAMSGGSRFQHRCAACAATKVVAESAASPGWDLPGDVSLEFIRCETEQPLDDLLVGTSVGGHVFGQAKTALSLSPSATSEFGKACEQFVRQYILHLGKKVPAPGAKPWERELDPHRDRLVLLTGPEAPGTVRNDLASALKRMRDGLPVDDTVAKDERHAADVLLGHLRRCLGIYRPGFDEADVSRVASMIRVQVLDVSDDGDAVREAENLLRGVLVEPARAGEAFRLLDQTCEDLAARRSGEDRRGLRALLSAAGMLATPAGSYAPDVARLREHTTETMARVRRLSRIDAGPVRVKVRRTVTDELLRAAADGSLLVTGEPGAGKSGVAHDAAEALQAIAHDVVVLAADQLAAQSVGQLRSELGLRHDLTDVLAEWDGPSPGYLVVDALDAARSSGAADALRQLMRDVIAQNGRWRVVAVVRQYDLRHSSDLRRLFRHTTATPSGGGSAPDDLSRVRHLLVRPFDAAELNEVAAQSPELGALLAASSDAFRLLLAEPFNLSLAAALLEDGVAPGELGGIESQGQLLDRYWEERVRKRDRNDREAVLLKVCQAMIGARQLRADRRDVHVPATSALEDLLSGGPLVQWRPRPGARPDEYVLAFSHNVIFDYAAARLLLRGLPERAVAFLESEEADLPVLLRPSLALHARHLWGSDRAAFWTFALRCAERDGLSDVVKLVAPAEAAALAAERGDFDPVCAAVESDHATGSAALTVLRHLAGALQAGVAHPFGTRATPWYELMERVSRIDARPVLAQVRQLVAATDDPARMDGEQRRLFNAAARRLLAHVLRQPGGDRYTSSVAIGAVCRTIASAPAESAALVRQLLEPARLARHGSEELFRAANGIEGWAASDPSLAEAVFTAAFTATLPAAETTTLFDSRIFDATSTRKQDFQVTLHGLADDFPAFLRIDPVRAARAASAALDAYVRAEHLPGLGREVVETFQFRGAAAGVLADGSVIWNTDRRDDEPPVQVLRALMSEVRRLAAAADPRLEAVVAASLSGTKPAVLWAEFLATGADLPIQLGPYLAELLTVPAILGSADTWRASLAMLRATYAGQAPARRAAIESAVIAVRDRSHDDEGARRFFARVAGQMLLALPEELLVTDAVRNARAQLSPPVTPSAPADEPRAEPRAASGATAADAGAAADGDTDDDEVDLEEIRLLPVAEYRPFDEAAYWRRQGVEPTAPSNAAVLAAVVPVASFVKDHLNGTPPAEVVPASFAAALQLHSALRQVPAIPTDAAPPHLLHHGWHALANAAERITRTDLGALGAADVSTLRQMLLDASRVRGAGEAQAARLTSAAGLVRLAAASDAEVATALTALAQDEAPAVRREGIRLLPHLHAVAPEAVWQAVEERASAETDPLALEILILNAAGPLAHTDPARGHAVLDRVYQRATSAGEELADVAAACAVAIYFQWAYHGHGASGQLALRLAREPVEQGAAAARVVAESRPLVVYGSADTPDTAADTIRGRVVNFMTTLATAAADEYESLQARFRAATSDDERNALRQRYNILGSVLHQLVSTIYFGSGAYDEGKARKAEAAGRTQGADADDPRATPAQRRRLLREFGPAFGALARVEQPAVSHRLIEILASLAEFGPATVFLQVRDIVLASTAAGLQYESLAAGTIARLLEMYLVEHRTVLQGSAECRKALLQILQAFIDWPEARKLVYRLDEIDR